MAAKKVRWIICFGNPDDKWLRSSGLNSDTVLIKTGSAGLTERQLSQWRDVHGDQWVRSSMAMKRPAMTQELTLTFLASPQNTLMTM